MPAEDAEPPNQRTRAAIGAVSLLVTVAAWLVLVLHDQYQVAWLGPYATLSDLVFLAGVAGIVLSRSAARWSAVRAGDLVRRLAILLVGIAAALLVSEYVTRFVFRHATSSGNPADYLAQHGGGPQVSFNSLGFREREVGPKDPKRYRIAVIGDSFTWGQGIEEADRYSNLLGGFLGPQFDVLNFGRPGHNMPEHLDDLDQVLKLHPDFVVLQLFINNFETASMRRPQTYTLLPQDLDAWMVRSSVVYRLLSDRWTLFLESIGFAESYADYLRRHLQDPNSPDAREAFGMLGQFIDRARAAGVPSGVVLFPAADAMGPFAADYPFDFLHERVKAICAEKQVPYLDLLPAFTKIRDPHSTWVSPFDAHPNAQTNRRAAFQILSTFGASWRH
jgi:lysophospholipase L1-like esterase